MGRRDARARHIADVDWGTWEAHDPATLVFVVRDCTLSYKRPAKLDDILEVHSRFLELGGATLSAEQVIRRDTTELARLDVRLACMGGGGRPSRIPSVLRDALAGYRGDAERTHDSTEMNRDSTEKRD